MSYTNKPKLLFIEPTLGIPLQPLLIDKICSSYNFDQIIWLQLGDQNSNSCNQLSMLLGRSISTLEETIPHKQHATIRNEAICIAENLLIQVSEYSEGLHKLNLDNVPIGLYLVSFLQRHNIDLCINWKLPKTKIKSLLAEWITYSLSLKFLLNKCSSESAGIFTHHVYFYGYISEFLYRYGIRSLTNGSPSIPLLKPRKDSNEPYSWSMGKHRQHQISIPTSCYEHSQKSDKFSNEYLKFICNSLAAKVSNNSFNSLLEESNYKKIKTFLAKSNIPVWQQKEDFALFQNKSDALHFCFHLHSFSDSTFTYDYDGFDTLIDYFSEISYALSETFPNATFYIRPHPNIFSKFFTDRVDRDIKTTMHLIGKLTENINNLVFMMPTISNSSFFDLSQNAIVVTHHSPSMALEATYANRFTITSASSIKIKLKSPLIVKVTSKETLKSDVEAMKNLIQNKPSLSKHDINYLISKSVPKLFYNPIYNNKVVRTLHLPTLLAGYGDFHKEFAPIINSICAKNKIYDLKTLKEILKTEAGSISCKYFTKEIEYMTRLLLE